MHQSERAFRAHATGPQVKRRAGLTGSCCRGAGHDEGEKEGSKGLPGQNFSKGLYSLLPRHGVHRDVMNHVKIMQSFVLSCVPFKERNCATKLKHPSLPPVSPRGGVDKRPAGPHQAAEARSRFGRVGRTLPPGVIGAGPQLVLATRRPGRSVAGGAAFRS